MGTITKFEDLKIWQEARHLVNEIYSLTKSSRDYDFNNQIQRASISVMNNIAEGFERSGNKEFIHFLRIAKASCGEVRSMLYLAEDFGILDINKILELREECFHLGNALNNFKSYLEKSSK